MLSMWPLSWASIRSLVIALAGTPEPVLEQVVGLQLREGPGALTPAVPQYLRHRQPGIVAEDAPGNSAQEGLAEVALRMARRMGQRHEHLLGLAAVLPDVVLDDGVPAVKAVLVPEPLEDALAVWRCFLGTR